MDEKILDLDLIQECVPGMKRGGTEGSFTLEKKHFGDSRQGGSDGGN